MGKDKYLRYFVIGIFLLLIFIAYRLYTQKEGTPKTELDCLKLGSNARAAACLKLLKKPKENLDFPVSYLSVSDIKAINTGYCIEVSGVATNNSSLEAQYVTLKIDFTKSQDGEPFHYETFLPFQLSNERLQPNSSKTFTKCLRHQSFDAVKDTQNWYFSITSFSAKIYEEN